MATARISLANEDPVDICLISPGLPTSNPRLVKEAGALVRAGYRVHCVVGDYPTPLRDNDESIIASAGATMSRVGLGSRWSYRVRRAVQLVSRRAIGASASDRMLARACSPQSLRLAESAIPIRARLYIGHTLPALPAAVLAAEANRSLAGFDAEDCHSEESTDLDTNRMAEAIERRFLPRCKHLTAAAPLIAAEYRRICGVEMVPVLNTFDAPTEFGAGRDRWTGEHPLSLYWFSQTVGPGRGLEQLIVAAGKARSQVQLCFRGSVSDEYGRELRDLARRAGLVREPQLLPPAHPDQMVPCAAEHDVGLSLELRHPRNRDLCLTNKLFTYLAAGIPQIVSRTAAQAELAAFLGDAASIVDLDDAAGMAAAIDRLATDPAAYRAAAATARRLYNERFSWQVESTRLTDAVLAVLKPGQFQPAEAIVNPRSFELYDNPAAERPWATEARQ
jgi:glycosyltransferase involved in cell wall biosynthesis